ncbi:MAG: glycoside hydrolase family 27 protein [Acidobacteriota bacterium]|nr:glycoside hydrolase family 27 protein [Acidobacteriota bacterium]
MLSRLVVAYARSRSNRIRIAFFLITALLLLAAPLFAQTLSGRWASEGRKLDNGETELTILTIKQDGSNLTGTLESTGFSVELKGTVTGNHFELFGEDRPNRALLEGDLVNGELQGKVFGRRPFTAHPATAAEVIPSIPYIQPPALHPVPSNGLAKTPPMGWNSWNLFKSKVTDKLVREIADAMVTSGMRDAGYIYVNIDDTWEGTRDANGELHPNSKFPDMKALADYVHSKGLKLGIYSGPGPRTCGGYPATYGHEEQDARMFASWGIDYVKYDWCSAARIYKDSDMQAVYQKFGAALHSTGRPIVYSLCQYGRDKVETWGTEVGGNLWRTTDDISDHWDSMIGNLEKQVPTAPYAGPGHWNDPDMLEVGNGGMTDTEYRTHMSLWALVAAPLLAGNDIRDMSDATKAILMNKEVIAIDQDRLGKQASPAKEGNLERWVKPLANGDAAVGIVNLGDTPATATVNAGYLGLHGKVKHARDLWKHEDVQFKNGEYSAEVPSHGILLLRVSAH